MSLSLLRLTLALLSLGPLACKGSTDPAAPTPSSEVAEPTTFETRSTLVMATRLEVMAQRTQIERAMDIVREVFEHVDAEMSEWKATSPLYAVNGAAGQGAVPVSAEVRALIRRGIDLGRSTDGAFDITWAALWGLWDFKSDSPSVPSDAAIAERVSRIDYAKVQVDDAAGTVALPEAGMTLGLGGIAKGYALDVAAKRLRDAGVDDFMISGGGQVYVSGSRDGRPWRVGIRDPRGGPADFFALVELSSGSVSTSGDYERYFELGGIRYHHILDPRTGRPARGVRSATVIGEDATLADALSTALVVMGAEAGLKLAEETAGIEAVIVDDQGKVHQTRGARLVMAHPPRSD